MSVPVRLQSRHALNALVVQMVGVAVGYGLHVALARWMGPADYGSYSYTMAWIGLTAIATALGLPVCSVRFVSQYRSQAEPGLLRGTIRRFRQLALAVGAAAAAVGTVAAFLVPGLPRWVAIAAWLIPLSSFVSLNTEIARGLGRPGLSQIPDKILRPALTVGAAAVFVAAGALTVAAAMIAATAAAGVVALVQLVAIRGALPPDVPHAVPEYRTAEWTGVATSLLAVSFLVMLLGQLDVLIAGFFLDPAQIGIYTAAIRVTTLIGFVPLAVMIVASPEIASLHAGNDGRALQELASRIAHLSFWPSLLATAGLIALATPILRLFGPDFVAARWVLWILAVTQLFKSAMGPVGYFLDMTGHQAYNARALAVVSVIGAGLNAFAIPRYGIIGAAAASLLSWVAVMCWLHYEVSQRVGVRASIVSALRLQRHASAVR